MNLAGHRMFQHMNWDPDRKELAKFSLSMLVGFALLGLLVAWRHHHVGQATFILWGAGLALAAGGAIPGLGRIVYLVVYLPTSVVGFFMSHLLLALIFFLVFTPIGLLLRLAGKDLLRLRPSGRNAGWIRKDSGKEPESYYHQF